jgi:hypothetical protein
VIPSVLDPFQIFTCLCVCECVTRCGSGKETVDRKYTHTFLSWNALVLYFLLFCVLSRLFLSLSSFARHALTLGGRPWMDGVAPSHFFFFSWWGPFPLYRDVPQRTWLWVRLHNLFFCVCVSYNKRKKKETEIIFKRSRRPRFGRIV